MHISSKQLNCLCELYTRVYCKIRCVGFLQKDLEKMRDKLANEVEQNRAKAAAAEKVMGSQQVLSVCMYVCTPEFNTIIHVFTAKSTNM